MSILGLGAVAVCTVVVAYPSFFLPWGMVNTGDLGAFHYPYMEALRRGLEERSVPLWFSGAYAGGYGLAESGLAFASPLHQMLRWLDTGLVIKIEVIFFCAVSYAGMCCWLELWLQDRRRSLLASLLSLIALQMHATLVWGHLTVLAGISIFPWLLYAAHRLAYSSSRREAAGRAAFCGLLYSALWIISHPQFILIFSEAAFVYLLAMLRCANRSWFDYRTAFFLIAFMLGIVGGWPQFHAAFEAIAGSGREATQADAYFLASGSLWPGQLLKWIAPTVFGAPPWYWGKAEFYAGQLFPGPLALALFLAGWRDLPGVLKFTVIACLLLAMGVYTPAWQIHGFIPGADLFRYPGRYLYACLPAVVLGVALGWRRIASGQCPTWVWLPSSVALIWVFACRLPVVGDLLPASAGRIWNEAGIGWGFALGPALELAALGLVVFHRLRLRFLALPAWGAAMLCLHMSLPFQQMSPAHRDDLFPRRNGFPERALVLDAGSRANFALLSGWHGLIGYSDMIQISYRGLLDALWPQDWRKQNRVQFACLEQDALAALGVDAVYEKLDHDGRPMGLLRLVPSAGRYSLVRDFSAPSLRTGSPFAARIHESQELLRRDFLKRFNLPPEARPAGGRVELRAWREEELCLRITCDGPALLVSSECFAPFWIASVDGKTERIEPWLGTFRALFLDAGTHDVVFKVDRAGFHRDVALGLVACIFLMGVMMQPWLARGSATPR